MQQLYLSHYDSQNQIEIAYAGIHIYFILIILLLFVLVSVKRKSARTFIENASDNYPDERTTIAIRGIAVLLLIIGHVAIKCISTITPITFSARWAVIIFLFLSGVGLVKKYGWSRLTVNFIKNRMMKLLMPLWLTLILFYALNYLFLDWRESPQKILLTFIGILFPWRPNDSAWFITYILFLYSIYYLISLMKMSHYAKIILIFLISYVAMFMIIGTDLWNYFGIWVEYTCIFPTAVLVGIYRREMYNHLTSLYAKNIIIYLVILLLCISAFIYHDGSRNMYLIIQRAIPLNQILYTVQPLFAFIPLMMLTVYIEKTSYESRFLIYLGEYSYELYLLHLPFIIYYDFFLFRKPLTLYFFVYLSFVGLLALSLRHITDYLNARCSNMHERYYRIKVNL